MRRSYDHYKLSGSLLIGTSSRESLLITSEGLAKATNIPHEKRHDQGLKLKRHLRNKHRILELKTTGTSDDSTLGLTKWQKEQMEGPSKEGIDYFEWNTQTKWQVQCKVFLLSTVMPDTTPLLDLFVKDKSITLYLAFCFNCYVD